jgi:hypothetical protein
MGSRWANLLQCYPRGPNLRGANLLQCYPRGPNLLQEVSIVLPCRHPAAEKTKRTSQRRSWLPSTPGPPTTTFAVLAVGGARFVASSRRENAAVVGVV